MGKSSKVRAVMHSNRTHRMLNNNGMCMLHASWYGNGFSTLWQQSFFEVLLHYIFIGDHTVTSWMKTLSYCFYFSSVRMQINNTWERRDIFDICGQIKGKYQQGGSYNDDWASGLFIIYIAYPQHIMSYSKLPSPQSGHFEWYRDSMLNDNFWNESRISGTTTDLHQPCRSLRIVLRDLLLTFLVVLLVISEPDPLF